MAPELPPGPGGQAVNDHSATPEQIRADAARQLSDLNTPPVSDPTAEPSTKLIASRLRALRSARGWSLARAGAEIAILNGQTLGRLERADRALTVPELFAIANAYDVPVPQLVKIGEICPTCEQELPI